MIHFRPVLCRISAIRNNLCYYSTSNNQKYVNTEINNQTNIITLTLNRPPVNSLNLDLTKQLCDTLIGLEKYKPKCLILKSFSDKVFSAGLDLSEIYKPDEKRLRILWRSLQDVMITLYGFSYPTIAVVNGHAPAGGCLLTLCCDYRIMVNNFSIGLNEVPVGIPVPPWLALVMGNTIKKRNAELALTTGRLFKTDEAFKIGLIDEVASDTLDAVEKAMKFIEQHKDINGEARAYTKKCLREADIEFMKKIQDKDVETSTALIMKPEVQHNIENYFRKIKK